VRPEVVFDVRGPKSLLEACPDGKEGEIVGLVWDQGSPSAEEPRFALVALGREGNMDQYRGLFFEAAIPKSPNPKAAVCKGEYSTVPTFYGRRDLAQDVRGVSQCHHAEIQRRHAIQRHTQQGNRVLSYGHFALLRP